MNISTIIALCALGTTIIGVICAILGYQKGIKKDYNNDGRISGQLMSDVGYIKAGVDDVKRKQETSEARHFALAERVKGVEDSCDHAHKRIDRIEGKNNV